MDNDFCTEVLLNPTSLADLLNNLKFATKPNLYIAVILIFTLFLVLYRWIHSLCKPQCNIVLPGPSKLPLIGSVHHIIKPGVDKLQLFIDWAAEYGSIFKLTMLLDDFFIVNNPAMIQKILGSSNPAHLQKHQFLYNVILTDALDSGLIGSDVKFWAPHRKTLSRSFTYKSLCSHLSIMNSHMEEFICKLGENIDNNNSPCDFSKMLHFSTIKMILDVLIGPNICTEQEIHEFNKAFEVGKEVIAQKVIQPWLLLKPIWKFHPLKRHLEKSLLTGNIFVQNATNRKRQLRKEDNQKKQDSFDLNDNESPASKSIVDDMLDAGMSDKEIYDEFMTIILAGHETTCSAISFLFLQLALNPDHQQLCRAEVDRIYEREDRHSGDTLSMADVCDLKHLERCAQESLRLAPVVPGIIRQIQEPIKLDDKVTLDAGSNIFISPWTLHRNPEIYPNPDKFDPDRFLPENCVARHPYAYIPFSAGPRNCIGWKFGMIEIKVIAARILRHFQIFTEHKSMHDAKLDVEVPTLIPSAGFKLFFTRRS